MHLEKKLVILTGSTGALGKATATKLSNIDCKLALIGRDELSLKSLEESLSNGLAEIKAYTHNFSKESDYKNLITKIEADFNNPTSLLINIAATSSAGPFLEIPPNEFIYNLQINTITPIELTRAVLPSMISNNYGKIVYVSSGAALRGLPGFAPYCISKAALSNFVESIRSEFCNTNISFLTFYPGTIKSDFNKKTKVFGPIKFYGSHLGNEPDKIADLLLRTINSNRIRYSQKGPALFAFYLNLLVPKLIDKYLKRKIAF